MEIAAGQNKLKNEEERRTGVIIRKLGFQGRREKGGGRQPSPLPTMEQNFFSRKTEKQYFYV